MDIIKNKMLASLEKQHGINIENAYENWQDLLSYLPEYQDQERFLRHYYNAFKVYPVKKIDNYAKATKSNLIKIYEHYINKGAKGIFDELLEKSKLYNRFIQPESQDNGEQIEHYKLLTELKRVGSSPSYLLLLYLYSLDEGHYEDKQATLKDVLYFLWLYYVRRNITDFPNTKDLDAINIELIETCQNAVDRNIKITSDLVTDKIYNGKGKPVSFEKFGESLADNLFYHNSAMARYVLVKLEERAQSEEYKPDLWARSDKGILVWTVEHIFPQGSNIPDCWVSMVAAGDKELASEIQEKWVHCLGNLTLSGYNSKLSNACFEDKQNLCLEKRFLGHKINIGYKNNLYLNQIEFNVDNQEPESLKTISKWTQKSIAARNDAIVRMLLEKFAFANEEHKIARSNICS